MKPVLLLLGIVFSCIAQDDREAALSYVAAWQLGTPEKKIIAEQKLKGLEVTKAEVKRELQSLGWDYCIGSWTMGANKQEFSVEDGLLIKLEAQSVATGVVSPPETNIEHFVGYLAYESIRLVKIEEALSDDLNILPGAAVQVFPGFGYLRHLNQIQVIHDSSKFLLDIESSPIASKLYRLDSKSDIFSKITVSQKYGISIRPGGARLWSSAIKNKGRLGAVIISVKGSGTLTEPYVETGQPILPKLILGFAKILRNDESENVVIFGKFKSLSEFKSAAKTKNVERWSMEPAFAEDIDDSELRNNKDWLHLLIDSEAQAQRNVVLERKIQDDQILKLLPRTPTNP